MLEHRGEQAVPLLTSTETLDPQHVHMAAKDWAILLAFDLDYCRCCGHDLTIASEDLLAAARSRATRRCDACVDGACLDGHMHRLTDRGTARCMDIREGADPHLRHGSVETAGGRRGSLFGLASDKKWVGTAKQVPAPLDLLLLLTL